MTSLGHLTERAPLPLWTPYRWTVLAPAKHTTVIPVRHSFQFLICWSLEITPSEASTGQWTKGHRLPLSGEDRYAVIEKAIVLFYSCPAVL